jgi:hypothetical protein
MIVYDAVKLRHGTIDVSATFVERSRRLFYRRSSRVRYQHNLSIPICYFIAAMKVPFRLESFLGSLVAKLLERQSVAITFFFLELSHVLHQNCGIFGISGKLL